MIKNRRRILLVWILGTPFTAVIIFLLLSLIFNQNPVEQFHNDGNVARLLNRVKLLEAATVHNPKQPNKQLILANSYRIMGQYPKAIIAYGEAWEKVKNSPDDLVHFAEVLYRQHGNNFEGKPLELINQALQINNRHTDGLILRGAAMLQQKENAQAILNWITAKKHLPKADPRKKELAEMLKKLNR